MQIGARLPNFYGGYKQVSSNNRGHIRRQMNRLFIIFFLVSTFIVHGQCQKTIEEIALYHLDKLTQDKKLNFPYFTNGYVEKDTTYVGDLLSFSKLKYKNDTVIFVNPFKTCVVIENKNLTLIPIPNKLRREKNNPVLNIYRFVKYRNFYYVGFSLESDIDVGGKSVILILNLQGDLININYSTYIQ